MHNNKYHNQNMLQNTTVNDITGWTIAGNLPEPLFNSSAVIIKNKVYLLGGTTNNLNTNAIYVAPINNDGTLGDWIKIDKTLPIAKCNTQIVKVKNKLYLIGGGIQDQSIIYTTIDNNGNIIGDWTVEANLLEALNSCQTVVIKNKLYILGGHNGYICTPNVYVISINNDGTLSNWTIDAKLPRPVDRSQAIVTKSCVYLLGGWRGTSSLTMVYSAVINNDDGSLYKWVIDFDLPCPLCSSQVVMTKNRVYLLGGWNGIAVSSVYTAPINDNGILCKWTLGTSLPGPLGSSQVIVTKNRVYLLGGHDGSNAVSTIYTAPFADGWEITE